LSLTIIYATGVKLVYRLDGTEMPHMDAVFKTVWQGAKVVTTEAGHDERGPTMTTETRSLEGQWMVVETVKKAPTGGDVTTQLYYAKTPKE
jgi:hypothetical protein